MMRARKSLIVALSEAKGDPTIPEIANLQDWTKKMAVMGAEVDGALELAWRRGEQAGYLKGYSDAKRGRRNKWALK
jgi:hypothetical protein